MDREEIMERETQRNTEKLKRIKIKKEKFIPT